MRAHGTAGAVWSGGRESGLARRRRWRSGPAGAIWPGGGWERLELGEGVPGAALGRGGLALGAVAPEVAPAAAGASAGRERLVPFLPGQARPHRLVGVGALGGDVLGPAQVPLQRFR